MCQRTRGPFGGEEGKWNEGDVFLFFLGTTIVAASVGLELRYYDMIDCSAD